MSSEEECKVDMGSASTCKELGVRVRNIPLDLDIILPTGGRTNACTCKHMLETITIIMNTKQDNDNTGIFSERYERITLYCKIVFSALASGVDRILFPCARILSKSMSRLMAIFVLSSDDRFGQHSMKQVVSTQS